MPAVIEDWLELESDPGLFTMLIENIGVKGVQVEDIYDLTEEIKEEVFGFVFLFKWKGESKKNKRYDYSVHNSNNEYNKSGAIYNINSSKNIIYETDTDKLNKIYFAHQVIPNSCATNALLSVLMNCNDRINLGSVLNNFREMTINMTPEKRGLALGTMPELANAHNKRGRYSCLNIQNLNHNMSTILSTSKSSFSENNPDNEEMYHFVSYLPIGDGLYELDGLQQYPIKHGITKDSENWTKLCLDMIRNRMLQESDRYSLMAIVKDRRNVLADQLRVLNRNKFVLQNALFQMEQVIPLEFNVKEEMTENRDEMKTRSSGEDSEKLAVVYSNTRESVISNDSEDLGKIKVEKVRRMSSRVMLKNQQKAEELKKRQKISTSPNEISHSRKKTKLNLRNAKQSTSKDIKNKNGSLVDKKSSIATNSSHSHKKRVSKYPIRSSKKRGTSSFNSSEDLGSMDIAISDSVKTEPISESDDKFPTFSPEKIRQLIQIVDETTSNCKSKMLDEIEKRKRYITDDMRRSFNYDDFIHGFLFALKKQGILEELLKEQTQKLMLPKRPTKRSSYRSSISSKRLKLITVPDSALLGEKFSKKSSVSNNRRCGQNIV